MFTSSLLSLAAVASTALAAPHLHSRAEPKCPIVFDGRVPVGSAPTFTDRNTSDVIFNPEFTKADIPWSQILKFPNTTSRFDGDKFTAVEVTLSDKSIFQKQNGFRRAGLQFNKEAPDGEGGKGVKTLHWSVKQDAARTLNLTHEYLNVWHEAADFSANQIQFQTGTLLTNTTTDKNSFKILDRENKVLWSVPMCNQDWQNFAVTLDYVKNQVTIYYSSGMAPLEVAAGPVKADLSGGGQFQMGMLKKPTGTDDVVNSGFQESGIDEGQIYGGLFVEDSKDGCVSL